MILKGLSGQSYQTEAKPFSSGGEGDIYGVTGVQGQVIKIYHADRITTELEQKLRVMSNQPPSSKVLSQVAWPLDVVYNTAGAFCGFVMPRLNITDELNAIYSYPPSNQNQISYKAKVIIAQNICAVISEVHRAGFIFGDFNPKNIGIDRNTCRVAFLDTDSYHIVDGGHTYRCKVCLDGYVAPELLAKCEPYKSDAYASAPLPTFTKETDNFALAIHIFKLLMNGFTPFSGIKETESASSASPGTGNQAIKRDNYCFKSGNKPQSAAVPPLQTLPGEIANLFTRAFIDGRRDPLRRPTALEWHTALMNYESSLVPCSQNRQHMYRRGLSSCPWCKADEDFAVAMGLQQRTYNGSGIIQLPPNSNTAGNTGGVGQGGSTYTRQSSQVKTSRHPAKKSNRWKVIVGIIAAAALFSVFWKDSFRTGSSGDRDTSPPPAVTEPQDPEPSGEDYGDTADIEAVPVLTTIESGFEVEDNGSYFAANEILVNERYTGSLSDTYNSEQDWYVFTLNEYCAVNVSFYTVEQPDTSAFWDVSIRPGNDPDANIWQAYINGEVTETNSGSLLLGAGTYYFEAESSNMHTTDPYSFQVNARNISSLEIPPIEASEISLPAIELSALDIEPANIVEVNGIIYEEGQSDEYSFTPERSGTYYFGLANVPEGFSYRISVYNSGGSRLDYGNYSNGNGLTITLSEGQGYTVAVGYTSYTGSYTLNIGTQTPSVNTNSYTDFNDSIQFKNQKNYYTVTPERDGTYYFGLTNVLEGYSYRISIYNSGGSRLDYGNYSNGNGLTVSLTGGQTYTVVVEYNNYFGSYTLSLGRQKPITDITNCTLVNDSIQFKNQKNYYTLIPTFDGTYYLGMTNIPEGYSYRISVYNSGGSRLDYGNYSNDNGIAISLSSGQTYTVVVEYNNYFGEYSLAVGKQKESVDISDYDTVNDSIQFKNQKNCYLFTPDKDYSYAFTLSNTRQGATYRISVYNAGGSRLDYGNYSEGNGLTLSLTGGQTYKVTVEYNNYFGSYSLNLTEK